MLAFFSISTGLWGNFRQLWLQDNAFPVQSISNIISLGTLLSVIVIALIGKIIKLDKLKNTILIALIIKFVNMLFLFFTNKTGLNTYLNVFIIVDIITENLTIASIYPLLTTINKNEKIYSKRKLTEYLFRDIGILFGGIFIGRIVAGVAINYNVCLIIADLFLFLSIITLLKIKLQCDNANINENSCLKAIIKNKILKIYLIYRLIGTIAMSTALGLKMITLTNYFNFSDNVATTYLLAIGLLADVFGIIALRYLTPKNDYVTISIKFGIRLLAYIIAFLSNNLWITFGAMSWSIFISTSYENVCDGIYINMLENKYQLSFSNISNIIKSLGQSIGIFLCGSMYAIGLRYMFGLSAIFIILQLSLAYYLIWLRKNKK